MVHRFLPLFFLSGCGGHEAGAILAIRNIP